MFGRKRNRKLLTLMVTGLFLTMPFLYAMLHLMVSSRCKTPGNIDTISVYMQAQDQNGEVPNRMQVRRSVTKVKPFDGDAGRSFNRAKRTNGADKEKAKGVTKEAGNSYDSNSKTQFDDENLLANFSLSHLRHVTENDGLNKTQFAEWTEAYLSTGRTKPLKMPRLVISGNNVCDNDTELLILMPAVPEYQFTREVIRQTWAGFQYGIPWPRRRLHLNTKLIFLVGTYGLSDFKHSVLKRESEEYGDIVAADFLDSYRNLTLKMVVGLNWVSQFCPSARFMIKCDLDTFLNLPLLTKVISVIHAKVPQFVLGHKHELPLPPVLRTGKWEISKDDYPFDYFPPYVIGHSYVITANLVPKMVSVARSLPLIPAEDAHVTGVLARVIRAPRLHYNGFAHLNKDCLPCNIIYNEDLSMTKMSLSRLLLMWRDVLMDRCSFGELRPRPNLLTQSQLQEHLKTKQGQPQQPSEHEQRERSPQLKNEQQRQQQKRNESHLRFPEKAPNKLETPSEKDSGAISNNNVESRQKDSLVDQVWRSIWSYGKLVLD